MHQTRRTTTKKLPIARKGTKYVARALSHVKESVPVVIAIRDILKLSKTSKEVKKMISKKALKINGKPVRDHRQSIKLFNVLEAGKFYRLSLSPTGKFTLEEIKNTNERLCKVVGRKILNKNKIQLNFHDGSNIITKEKIAVGDSVYLDFSGKLTKHIVLDKAKEVFVMSGKYAGNKGKIFLLKDKKAVVKFKDNEAELSTVQLIAQ